MVPLFADYPKRIGKERLSVLISKTFGARVFVILYLDNLL